MFRRLLSLSVTLFFAIFLVLILAFTLRGQSGNPDASELNTTVWRDEGPLELSPERGRFALAYSIVENNSVIFSIPIARLATPDLGMRPDGQYVSLFAPGVSYLIIPGYIIGKTLGASQIGAFSIIAIFAFLNTFIIKKILDSLGVKKSVAYLSSLVFLIATPAFAYAVNLYQHHISTFFILICLYILIKTKNLLWISLIWVIYGFSFIVDYPNAILLFPIALAALGKIVYPYWKDSAIAIRLSAVGMLTFFTGLIPLFFLLWYNGSAYNNPLQLAGTLKAVKELTPEGKPTSPNITEAQPLLNLQTQSQTDEKTTTGFFQNRNLLRGFIVHFIGLDRGILFFTPVILLGFIGIITSYRRAVPFYATMVGLVAINIILYSLWNDPWGGWAFGSRYLIPSYAILSIFIGLLLSRYSKYIFIVLLFSCLFFYSFSINLLGALTSSRIPPKVEVLALEELSGQRQRYSYDRDIEFLKNNNSKSAFWQTYGHRYMTAGEYYWLIFSAVTLAVIPFILLSYRSIKK